MPSFKTPTQQQIEAAVQRMRSPEFTAYFLSRLQNPLWVTPLRKQGVFKNPPPPVPSGEQRITFPNWPASRYLARMSGHVPGEVAEIFKQLETENVSVIGDLLNAAVAMPAEHGAKLVASIVKAAKGKLLWIQFTDACDLCITLARGAELRAALTLADALFSPELKPGRENPDHDDRYSFTEGLAKVLPVLTSLDARQVLNRLCNWLSLWVKAKKHVTSGSGADFSWSWRPAVEEHEQNRDHDLGGHMVGFVRQGFDQAIRERNIPLEKALGILDQQKWQIFKRIKMHFIAEYAEQCTELAKQLVMTRELFDDSYYKHEYAVLVGSRLDILSPDEREQWFSWVDAGPDIAHFSEFIKSSHGRDPTDEERANRKRYWQFEKYHCVQKHLSGTRKKVYDSMMAQHGEPALADLNSRISCGWGHDSPMKVEDLTALTFGEAVTRVVTWTPTKGRFVGPDIEGLASIFEQYISTNPGGLSKEAGCLKSKPALYVRSFIRQMAVAVKAGVTIDARSVLELAQWVLERPVDEQPVPEQEGVVLADRGWQWTRDEIARFVQSICQAMDKDIPRYQLDHLREPVWRVIHSLHQDRATSDVIHDLSKEDPRLQNYLSHGMNSPRGRAVEAALDYARWVANHIKKQDGTQETIPGGFGSMPEIREVLEWHTNHRSITAMAMVGADLGLIYWVDKDWLAKHGKQLFFLEGIEQTPRVSDGWAAWNSFLVSVPPHVEYYRLFKEEFAYAVTQSSKLESTTDSPESPMNHLGEHLVLLYARGQLGFDDDSGVFRRFLSQSHPSIRRHVIGFIGRILEKDKDVPEEAINRLKKLWEAYWAGAGRKDAEEDPSAWLFGLWFSSGRFPEKWAMDHLDEFSKVTPTPEPDHSVVEQLATVASADIEKAANILERMVHGDREGWRVHGWLGPMRKLLELAIKAGGKSRARAVGIINHVGRRGHTNLGDLLPPE